MTTILRLAALIAEQGLTKAEVARRAKLSYQAVHHLCSGDAQAVTLDTVDRLAKALSVEPGELFERKAGKK